MRIPLIDRSLYFKGLMLLVRKDREIRDAEKNIILHIGDLLGFDRKFCESTLVEILDNKHVVDEPPRFSRKDIAQCFVKDGMRVSLADQQIHEAELEWLKAVVRANGLSEGFYDDSLNMAIKAIRQTHDDGLEARHFVWD